MSQSLNKENSVVSVNGNSAVPEAHTVQIGLRLRAVDHSDRAIVSNISAVQAGSGMVFIDFGFLEQQAINEIGKLTATPAHTNATIDGRLECRIAMGLDQIAQLYRQLERVLAANRKFAATPAAIDPIATDSDTTLQ